MENTKARLLISGWHLLARYNIRKRRLRAPRPHNHCTAVRSMTSVGDLEYVCDVEAEPLHRYRPGGHHPVRIGDFLDDGRYKVLHKLGWGGFSTVWAAQAQRLAYIASKKLCSSQYQAQRYVALKIVVAERGEQAQESRVMRAVVTAKSDHSGFRHLFWMTNRFQLHGPNGIHECLVLEIMGSSIPDILERRFSDTRLPGKLAKGIAKQALLGLHCLHRQGIVHRGLWLGRGRISNLLIGSDLHTRNLAFVAPIEHSLSEEDFLKQLKKAQIGAVRRTDGEPLEPSMPEYLVRPTSRPVDLSPASAIIRIVDFGEFFFVSHPRIEPHTPLVVRAPEIIFKDRLDHRVDPWTMGSMVGCSLNRVDDAVTRRNRRLRTQSNIFDSFLSWLQFSRSSIAL
jgi:serine/threonine-protein kinase SRPK3